MMDSKRCYVKKNQNWQLTLGSIYSQDNFLKFVLFTIDNFYDDYQKFVSQINVGEYNFKPVHLGVLIPDTNWRKVINFFLKKGFFVERQFQSEVVAKQLINKYHNENIKISIIKLLDANEKRLELFVCESGLSQDQLLNEVQDNFHFAFEVDSVDLNQKMFEQLINSGYSVIGGGVNEKEVVTIFYFYCDKTKIGPIKIELFVKGIYPKLAALGRSYLVDKNI